MFFAKTRAIPLLSLLILGLVNVVWFQNCTPQSFDGRASASTTKSSGGDNYDGKIFDHIDPLNQCDDKSFLQARILRATVRGDVRYSLLRKSCVDISSPIEIPTSEIQSDPLRDEFLVFNGRTFLTDPAEEFIKPPISAEPIPRVAPNACLNYPACSGPISQVACETPPLQLPSRGSNSGGAQLYVFSMYNAVNSSHSTTHRTVAQMRVSIPSGAGPVTLLLSSYVPTQWVIEGVTSRVAKVLIRGFHCQTVTGVSAQKVELRSVEENTSSTFITSENLSSSATSAEQLFGLSLAKAQYIYEGACLGAFVAAP